jgi:hypothetical protein
MVGFYFSKRLRPMGPISLLIYLSFRYSATTSELGFNTVFVSLLLVAPLTLSASLRIEIATAGTPGTSGDPVAVPGSADAQLANSVAQWLGHTAVPILKPIESTCGHPADPQTYKSSAPSG